MRAVIDLLRDTHQRTNMKNKYDKLQILKPKRLFRQLAAEVCAPFAADLGTQASRGESGSH